jgi:putative protease
MPRYSLRVRNNEFDLPTIREAIDLAHRLDRHLYVTCNLLPHNSKLRTVLDDLAPVIEAGPDALIMADPGLIGWVRERWPELPIHLSVQANTMNWAAVDFWRRVGIRRVILSRELGLNEIAEIRQRCPETELEVFVHGALCIAHSGRCLLAGYMNHRDANQGSCTNACRWPYRVAGGEEERAGYTTARVEEARRPGEWMEVEEDQHGTYIFNSRDLRAVDHVAELCRIGVDSLKIEGRTKSNYYVARTTQIYRRAIDDATAGRPFDPDLLRQLDGMANRGYTDGFLQRHPPNGTQNYLYGSSRDDHQRLAGEILEHNQQTSEIIVAVRNRFSIGDRLEVITPNGNADLSLQQMSSLDGEAIDTAPGDGHTVRLPAPPGGPWESGFVVRYQIDPATG